MSDILKTVAQPDSGLTSTHLFSQAEYHFFEVKSFNEDGTLREDMVAEFMSYIGPLKSIEQHVISTAELNSYHFKQGKIEEGKSVLSAGFCGADTAPISKQPYSVLHGLVIV